MIGCKKGSLCSDINKELCCCECENFVKCKDVCEMSDSKNDILLTCSNAYYTEKV